MTEDGSHLFEGDAAMLIGEKLIEMADRLQPVAKVSPGSMARWGVTIDGTYFEVTLKVGSEP